MFDTPSGDVNLMLLGSKPVAQVRLKKRSAYFLYSVEVLIMSLGF